MGEGMAQYVDTDMGQGTETLDAYNLYCHMVAGLVGEGAAPRLKWKQRSTSAWPPARE